MRWSDVRLIFLRELRDQLRDRRTLFMITVLPIFLYPTIGIGLIQFATQFTKQTQQVLVRGAEHLPATPQLIAGKNFVPQLFEVEEEATQLEIVQESNDAQAQEMLEGGEVQVVLTVPARLRELIEAGQDFRFELSYKSADEKSRIAYLRLKEALENWKRVTIRQRLEAKGVDPEMANPAAVETQDIATAHEVSGFLIWAKLFPFLLVVMSLTGAFYPAVDLCAGEKERGTMETLLISPAGRAEIVIGKYLTVFLFSICTAILNLLSMAATGWVVARRMQDALPGHAQVAMLGPPSLTDACWILLLLPPLSAFFSALGIALAAFARSTKEGQYYLTPLFLVTMPLVMITLAPGVELNAFYSVVPVTGPAMLLRTLIQGQYSVALEYMLPVLLPTILYAVLALRWAIDQFNREEVLFREAERLDLWLWARHLLRDKEPFPSAVESMFCYAIMLMLVWFVLMGGFLTPAGLENPATRQAALQRPLIVMHIAFVAAPSIIMAIMLTTSVRKTLLLRGTTWLSFLLAPVLALALHPISVEANQLIHRGAPPQPKGVDELLNEMLGSGQPIWWQLFLVALLPAVCEELAFRGFILSGLLRRMSAPTAIIVSGFLFGFFHMNPQQLLTATVLGWILGLIATRTGSLLPGILFHFANNASALMMSHLQDKVEVLAHQGQSSGLLVRLFETLYRQPFAEVLSYHVPYRVSVLAICAIVATTVLMWLLKQPVRSPAAVSSESNMNETDSAFRPRTGGANTFGLGGFSTPDLGPLAPKTRDATP